MLYDRGVDKFMDPSAMPLVQARRTLGTMDGKDETQPD
jgi:hypothetical protein